MRISEPIAHGPYALSPGGYKETYEEEHTKMVQTHNEMRAIGETVTVPLMALAITNEGESASYVPMELGEPSDDGGERG